MAPRAELDSGKLRVGIAGCGLVGGRRAVEAARHPGTMLAKVAAANADRAKKLAGHFGAEAVSDWSDLVDDPSIDIVVVFTPNAYLAPIATAALANGKHVLVEKPAGRSLEGARQIGGPARASGGKVLKVGFNHRYHPALAGALSVAPDGRHRPYA